MNVQVKAGSRWQGTGRTQFVVISVVELDNHIWVHYREDISTREDLSTREYSCYEESFVQRFSLMLNQK